MSIENARSPKPGDTWVERGHIHICTVRGVCNAHVTLDWHTAAPHDEIMTRSAFRKFLTYTTNRHKTWCDCVGTTTSVNRD